MLVRKLTQVTFVFAEDPYGKWVIENGAMIEQLMSRSLARHHQGHAAWFVGFHVGPPSFCMYTAVPLSGSALTPPHGTAPVVPSCFEPRAAQVVEFWKLWS